VLTTKYGNMYTATYWITSLIMLIGSIYYCYEIAKNKVSPPPATFIILSMTFPFAFYMYMQKPDWSYTANIGLSSAVVCVWIVCAFLIGKLLYEKRLNVGITKFHWITIVSSIIVLFFWFITKDNFTAYILLQVSALIGYIPVIDKLLKAKRNFDSMIFWTSIFLSTLVASYAAWERNDIESWIYIGRAVPSTFIVIVLMIRLKLKKRLV
jgi:hypothetical protein